MNVPDYVLFEQGNPMTDCLVGEWFQTTDLFGYFEKYRIKADGTIWLTPTRLVPSKNMHDRVEAPTLIKVDLPEVQILVRSQLRLVGEQIELDVTFCEGKMDSVRQFCSVGDRVHVLNRPSATWTYQKDL